MASEGKLIASQLVEPETHPQIAHDRGDHTSSSVRELIGSSRVRNWEGEHAPFPHQPISIAAVITVPMLVLFAWVVVTLLRSNCAWVALGMLIYEAYIVFDHFPFIFTNCVYKSARVNFEHTALTAFWGMEATSSVISYFAVGSPWLVLGNVPNHTSFIFFNYVKEVATSETFVYSRKRWYLVVAVAFDTALHSISILYYIRFLFADGGFSGKTCIAWAIVNTVAILLTIWVHYDVMELGHLLVHFGWRPEDLHPERTTMRKHSSKQDFRSGFSKYVKLLLTHSIQL